MYSVILAENQCGFNWIDVLNPDESELQQLAAEYKLHPAALQDVLQPEHLPKAETFDDTEFIICRYYDTQSPKEADTIQKVSRKLAIFYRKNLVLTIHRADLPGYDKLKEKYMASCTLNAFEVVCKILKTALITYEEPVSKVETEIDFYESRIFLKKRIPDLIKSLFEIKRKINLFRKISNLTEEVIVHLSSHAGLNKSKPVFQDLMDYYKKIDTLIETNHDDINNLMNVYISISSQRTNEVMRTLTVFTAFFLPTTFIVGVYGMNFENMPELQHPYGYPAVLGFMFLVTILIYTWFKRKGWM